MIDLNKKYLNKYGAFLAVVLTLSVFVYQLHAQEVVPTSPEPSENETGVIDEVTSTTTETGEGETENLPEEEEEEQGLLGEFIDFVGDNIFNSGDPETQDYPATEEPIVDSIVSEEIIEESIPPLEGELKPAPFFENKNALLVRGEVDVKKESIDYTGGSYGCSVTPFSVNISNTSVIAKVYIENINQIGQEIKSLEVGELPGGFMITFANKQFSQRITSNNTEFDISLEKNKNSQKGSFTVPIIYSVGETAVICQVNIINR